VTDGVRQLGGLRPTRRTRLLVARLAVIVVIAAVAAGRARAGIRTRRHHANDLAGLSWQASASGSSVSSSSAWPRSAAFQRRWPRNTSHRHTGN
jgi:hypothetical protein